MADEQEKKTADEYAGEMAAAANDVKRLERDRATLAAQLEQMDQQIAEARARRDKAHEGLRGAA